MPGLRKRGEEIRDFITANITRSRNIAVLTSEKFGISLTAVYKHFDRLVMDDQLIKEAGRYVLKSNQYEYAYRINGTLAEDAVWESDIKRHFAGFRENVLKIWVYGFLEIFNNAIEHSKGKKIHVTIGGNRVFTAISISDDGIGIFKNIKAKFNLTDEKDALLELAKGKRTTNRASHSGQGIFFVSKAFDVFRIISNGIVFGPSPDETSGTETDKHKSSTLVLMRLANNSRRKLKDVFDRYSTEIPGDFDKTMVPVRLANSNDLVSRSQARRILSGLELFREVTLDFKGVEYIGQAFADEIFRVFTNMNQDTVILSQNANQEIQNMISRAKNTKL